MPVLDNPRHERFAQYLLKGKSAAEAYVMAGYRDNRHNASALAREQPILTRLQELQASAAVRAELTAADISRQLDEDRALAHKAEQAGAAVSASMGQAKLFGLIKERHEHTGANGGPIQTMDLSNLSDEQLNQLEAIFGPLAAARPGDGAGKGGETPPRGDTQH